MAALAHAHGLRAWSEELLPRLDLVEGGRFDATLADRLAELVGEFAEKVVKENPKASKEAANRLGTRCLLLTVASRVRRQIARAAQAGDMDALARATRRVDLIGELEREMRANVNLKHALADLVAQWGMA
jgi:NTP pyrophosphatase (non-canonical NTP hydrolase)